MKRDYSREDYVKQFTVRIPESLAKIGRIQEIYRMIADTPPIIGQVLADQKDRLVQARAKFGDYISPEKL